MNKFVKLVIAILVFIFLALIAIKLLSDEDTWTCQDGKWQKHGNPTSSMPTSSCPK